MSPRHRLPAARAGACALVGAALAAGTLGVTAPAAIAAPPAAIAAPARLAAAAGVDGPTAAETRMAGRLARRSQAGGLGPDLAGQVVDAATGRVLWSRTPFERQVPASNVKIITAVNALATLGPQSRIRTRVVQGGSAQAIVLVGGGDPSLSSSALRVLAGRTASALRAAGRDRVRLYLDDSLFPAPSAAPGWKASYLPTEIAPVRALVVDRAHVRDTSLDAQRRFAKRLRARDIRVTLRGRTRAPAAADELARVSSPQLSTLVSSMLRTSKNDYAEALHRLVAIRAGRAATWTGARKAQRSVLRSLGVDLGASTLHDGSGLSRANQLSPRVLVRVLRRARSARYPELAGLQDALPVAGRTGTLSRESGRYTTKPSRCATGRVQAKTGSLNGVVALSGYAQGADGSVRVFSFLLNRVPSTLATRRAVDKLAATVTGCW